MGWNRKEIVVYVFAAVFVLGMALVFFNGQIVEPLVWDQISPQQISLLVGGGILSLLSGGGLVAAALGWMRDPKSKKDRPEKEGKPHDK